MLEKEGEIIEAVKTRYSELEPLRKRWNDDYGLYRLEEYKLSDKEDYDNFTSNEPKTLANKIIEILAFAPMQIILPLDKQNEAERGNLSDGERMAYGGINLANSRLNDTFQLTIQEQLAFYATLFGMTVPRVYIYNNDKGNTILDIAIWNPLNVPWEVGGDGMAWVCHTRPISKNQAKDVYNVEIQGKNTTLYDFWDGTKNAILINNKFAQDPTEHGLGHIPVRVAGVGGAPFIQKEQNTQTNQDFVVCFFL